MKDQESNQENKHMPEKEGKTYSYDNYYIKKMENGYYKAFSNDGKEITGVNLPINICLDALCGKVPSFVKIYPSDMEIEIEPSLKILRDRFNEESGF